MTKPIDELISAFLESAEELKKSHANISNRITDIETTLNKQDLGEMKAGVLVTTEYCTVSHDTLERNVCGRADALEVSFCKKLGLFETSINRKIYASWLVLVVACSAIGWAVKTNSVFIHELTKVVFK